MTCTLSICLITKNEEHNLKRCINSVKKIADEIIVVDTGSTDSTIKLAKSLGAKVFSYQWVNDFSKARNFALDKCTKDWIFVIDADEALHKDNDTILKNSLLTTDKEGLYMQLNNIIGTTIINQNPTLRLFKNNKSYRYENKLHEQIVQSIGNSGEDVFGSTNAILNHYGYDHNVVNMDNKSERNIDILNSYIEEEKDSIYYFGLANEYMKLGKLLESKDLLIKALDYKGKDQGVSTYAALSLVQCCIQLEEFSTGLKYVNKFLKQYPDFKDLYFLKSACNGSLMKYSDSYIALTIFNSIPINTAKYPYFSFETNNDIPTLLTTLSQTRIPHSKKLVTTVITVSDINSNYKDTILNCNEISDEILVIDTTATKNISSIVTECGGTYISFDNTSLEELKFSLKSKCTSKWILYLDENKTLTHEARYQLVRNLSIGSIPKEYTIEKNF